MFLLQPHFAHGNAVVATTKQAPTKRKVINLRNAKKIESHGCACRSWKDLRKTSGSKRGTSS